MKYFIILLVALLINFVLENTSRKTITDPKEYDVFLQPGIIRREINQEKAQMVFWEKRLQKDTGNVVDMQELASGHLKLFKLGGTIADLHIADSLLKRSSS